MQEYLKNTKTPSTQQGKFHQACHPAERESSGMQRSRKMLFKVRKKSVNRKDPEMTLMVNLTEKDIFK